jgi:VanZ family protein
LATLYGLSDEWHQFYVPQRMSDWADVLADLVGSTLGCLTYIGIYLHLNRRITTPR